jgi:membrane protease subunit (stomatin/prohibitin family)
MNSSTNVITSLIQPSNTLNKNILLNNITKTISQEVTKISYLTNHNDMELIKYVGNLIENLVNKKMNVDKLQIFRNILTICFPNITSEELIISINMLENLLNNKLIKKIPLLKYCVYLSRELIGTFLKKV